MKRDVIRPWPNDPENRTPYVPALTVDGGRLLFLSGMGPHNPNHKHPHVPEEWILPDDAAAQARMVLEKIRRIVEAAGGSFRNVVKITRYFKDIGDQDKVNDLIHEYFGDSLPCSTTVQVSGFVVPTMLIEIDAWAVIPNGDAVGKPARKTAARKTAARKTAARKRSAGKAPARKAPPRKAPARKTGPGRTAGRAKAKRGRR